MTKPKAEFIDPPRRERLASPIFDDDALERAARAMEAVSPAFLEWMQADVEKLQAARLAAEDADWSDMALAALFAAAHDVKGMAATYGFPLATQLSASLCRFIETDAGKAAARDLPQLVCAHVDAVRATLRDGITSSAHPVGRALVQTLERQVSALGVALD